MLSGLARARAARGLRDEAGAIWVWLALVLPVAFVLSAFVIDVANWFEHHRHLQTQVDAAALAGGGRFAYPNCDDATIEDEALQYGGDLGRAPGAYNEQVSNETNVHVLFNSPDYWSSPSSSALENTDTGGPCAAEFLDVKATDDKPPLFFASLLPGIRPSIHAHARVEIKPLDIGSGQLPIAVPDPNPRKARAYFVNESTGAYLTDPATGARLSVPLFYNSTGGGLDYWSSLDMSVTPSVYHTVTLPSMPSGNVGIRIALSGSTTNDQCGQPLVSCYDTSGNTAPNGTTPLYGIDNIRVYDPAATPGTASANDAIAVYAAKLTTADCTNPYFLSADCSVRLHVRVRFAAGITPANVTMTARVDGAQQNNRQSAMAPGSSADCPPANPAGSLCYESTEDISVSGAGWHTIDIAWKDTTGTDSIGSSRCRNGNGNPCDSTGTAGKTAQRVFMGDFDHSGQIKWVDLLDGSGLQAEQGASTASHSYALGASTGQVGVGVKIDQAISTGAVTDPPMTLRFGSGGQTQGVACNPNTGPYQSANQDFKLELAFGCEPDYQRWQGAACPGSAPGTLYPGNTNELWTNVPTPWQCAAAESGVTPQKLVRGLNIRILGSESPSSCTAPNNWDPGGSSTWSPQDLDPDDPRIVTIFLVPYGTFGGTGNETYPVSRFVKFYITGWAGEGGSTPNPCQGAGDDPAGAGEVKGHFMTYVDASGRGTPGPGFCDTSGVDSCIATLTQ